MNILLDTNILGRMLEPTHAHHVVAIDAVAALLARGDEPCLVPQVLFEAWVVATRPLSANGLGLDPNRAGFELTRFETVYTRHPDPVTLYVHWKQLVTAYRVLGKSAHDARLVAAMGLHGWTHLLTFNTANFSRFPGIVAIDPASLLAPPTP